MGTSGHLHAPTVLPENMELGWMLYPKDKFLPHLEIEPLRPSHIQSLHWKSYPDAVFFIYEGWNFNSGSYLFTTDTKDTCFEVLLSFTVVTSIVYNPLPAMWKS